MLRVDTTVKNAATERAKPKPFQRTAFLWEQLKEDPRGEQLDESTARKRGVGTSEIISDKN